MYGFYEFFAGGGMVRAGLGDRWKCLFANDNSFKKGDAYTANWGRQELSIKNVGDLRVSELAQFADLAWASFPCQDLSLAGGGAGLAGTKSSAFWQFWSLIGKLRKELRAPKIIAIENVMGTLSSHNGSDFMAICAALVAEGYRFGAMCIDAALFLPQSRKRLFIIAVKEQYSVPMAIVSSVPTRWHPTSIITAVRKMPAEMSKSWIWWNPPEPIGERVTLRSVVGSIFDPADWHDAAYTDKLLRLMAPANLEKVKAQQLRGEEIVGTLYKRMRPSKANRNVQRAEVRFDGVAGCLRVPVGGSSRQTLIFVNGPLIKTRLISPREAARLMGLNESYILPENQNDALHLSGDGVVVPAVDFLARHILEPILDYAVEANSLAFTTAAVDPLSQGIAAE
ncbi:DNA (cytosine-5-)-methyltransferase [Ochrobactrum sp. BD67]